MKRNVLFVLAYDGSAFHGFQKQKSGMTVQRILEETLATLTKEHVRVHGAGRTDAGVHALSHVVNFKTESRIPPEGMKNALNAKFPPALRVVHAQDVDAGFHARRDAVRKTYRYVIFNGDVLLPFYRKYVWHLRAPELDHDFLNDAGKVFVGEHDFTSFMGSGSSVKSRVRRIESFRVERSGEFVVISVRGNGFLKNMVRNIVGTLVDVARGKIAPDELEGILKARNRKRAGMCAPGEGLYLCGVDYPNMSFRGILPFFVDFK